MKSEIDQNEIYYVKKSVKEINWKCFENLQKKRNNPGE